MLGSAALAFAIMVNLATAASDSDTTGIFLEVIPIIGVSCTGQVTMNAITGDGYSTLDANNESDL